MLKCLKSTAHAGLNTWVLFCSLAAYLFSCLERVFWETEITAITAQGFLRPFSKLILSVKFKIFILGVTNQLMISLDSTRSFVSQSGDGTDDHQFRSRTGDCWKAQLVTCSVC